MTSIWQPTIFRIILRFVIHCGLALSVLFAVGVSPGFASQPASSTAVVEEYLSAWQAGDTGRMYELLDNEAKRTVSPQEFADAFTIRLPFTDDRYVIRPVRFDHVRPRQGLAGVVDFRLVFTPESLLGPDGCSVFCRDRRDLLSPADARRARRQALYLLSEQARPQSPYVSIAYALGLWGLQQFSDLLPLQPTEHHLNPHPEQLPRLGLEADWELVVDTEAITIGPLQVSPSSLPFRLAALEVSEGGHIGAPFAPRSKESPVTTSLGEKDFDRLIWLLGLNLP